MKTKILLLLIFISSYGFSQSVNDYKAVIIPLKYDFMKTDNQYRLATLTKFNLNKAGFEAFYANDAIPQDYNRCDLLNVDVIRDNGFLVTKLYVVFKDCYGKIVFTSDIGKSKTKDFDGAYSEALNQAFLSINALHYKYNGTKATTTNNQTSVNNQVAVAPVAVTTNAAVVNTVVNNNDPNLLYAQPTETGYQLIDKTPKVVMKLMKTSRPDSFIAIKGDIQGSLNAKDNEWYFEYYKNDKLVSEKVIVKF
ncbi:hypothetical protein [Flavobacterium sp. AJR]|uniref:hypothetical protein n=1 Tax=Flavobacterium sp. AJR TaxID=1979369 RepID=UPI0005801A92|nr:hypothetical protein [Flavobacterium sp. AJR]KIC03476.1 hypothetical protein OA88_03640 [Flavobacterium sp. JRM]OUL64329.1 hypothetical protein B8T70_01150 [Flavobacterium sp. AJR]